MGVAVGARRGEEFDVADDAVGGALLAVFVVDLVLQAPVDLRAEIDAGTYTLNRMRRRSTRLPLKKLALHVAENFI